jgi:hypothetical protein
MNRRSFTAAALSAPLLSGCFYDRYFDIEWDEEVLLHDGRVIVVHVKNTYERQSKSLKQYDENNIKFRSKTLMFESAPGQQQTFHTRMPIAYLGKFNKDWYVVISGKGPYGNYPDEMPTRWGNDFRVTGSGLAFCLLNMQDHSIHHQM